MNDQRPGGAAERALPDISIIIPTLNEAHSIGHTLDAALRVRGRVEVIVVDGGSTDLTADVVRRHGVKLITSERGRGAQLGAGAKMARGSALWFLHADTPAIPEGAERIEEALRDGEVVGGNFSVRFDGGGHATRFLTWLYPRLRRLGLVYGDSAIFARRKIYEEVGGFRPSPIFEDVDLVRRLKKRGRFAHLPAVIVTSSRRFESRSFALTFARWSLLQALYWAGFPPRTLARLYAPVRRSTPKPECEADLPPAGEPGRSA